jgi:AcrR family transcriptional regulator
MAELGLRERKKLETRRRIAETARALFAERGFEKVTVAQVADAAEVAPQTVFNYFPHKEDLFFWQLESFEDELLATIRDREPGESLVDAFRRFLLSRRGLLGRHNPEARDRLVAITRMLAASPALLAREQQILDGYTASLAALIAGETRARPNDVRPRVAATAMMGVHRALIAHTRARILEGELGPGLAREVRGQADRAFALLADGLAGYGPKT